MAFNLRQMLIVAAAAVLVAVGAFYYFVMRPGTVALTGNEGGTITQSGDALMVAGPLEEMTLGDPKAPNVVVEYASLTCPHCQRFHAEVYPPFKTKYVDTGKVFFVFRNFSLNDLDSAAIMLTRCVPKERYFPLVDLLYDRQIEWAFVTDPVTALKNVVKQAGISEDAFKACLTNQTILDGVNWVRNRGENEFGVDSTPTFFINGKKVVGELTLETLDKEIGG